MTGIRGGKPSDRVVLARDRHAMFEKRARAMVKALNQVTKYHAAVELMTRYVYLIDAATRRECAKMVERMDVDPIKDGYEDDEGLPEAVVDDAVSDAANLIRDSIIAWKPLPEIAVPSWREAVEAQLKSNPIEEGKTT